MKLATPRLELRFIVLSDLDFIHKLHSIPEVDEYNTLGIPENLDTTKSIVEAFIVGNQAAELLNYSWTIEHSITGSFVGLFGLKLKAKKYRSGEVWFKLHPEFWLQGYATEALKTVINFGFETLELHRIEAGCAVHNLASIKVLEKCKMIQEGRGRKLLPLKSGWSDNYKYAILETDVRIMV